MRFFLVGLVGCLLLSYLMLRDPVEQCDTKQFDKIEREIIVAVKNELGIHCIGRAGSAPGGIIRNWRLVFVVAPIPAQQEALVLLHRMREIAARIFDENPAVLPHMYPDYVEAEKFNISISFLHEDGSVANDPDYLFEADLSYGKVRLRTHYDGLAHEVLNESYEDFLKRFPNTTLKPYRTDVSLPEAVSENDQLEGA